MAVDVWFFFIHGVGGPMRELVYNPVLLLMVLGLVVIATALHEIGHATAARYGGAKPGVMGAGIYIVWPAFYTDVTDAYRLNRKGRLRVDLGGVYFNVLFVLLVAGIYALTSFEPILILIVVQHMQIFQQFLPFLRLDGYYILSDLTGVPDMFARLKPTLKSAIPGQEADKKAARAEALGAGRRDPLGRAAHPDAPLHLRRDGLQRAPRDRDGLGLVLPPLRPGVAELRRRLRPERDDRERPDGDARPPRDRHDRDARARRQAHGDRRLELVGGLRRSGARLVTVVGGSLLTLMAFIWWPNGEYRPIQPGEKGTLSGAVEQFDYISTGRPGLTAEREEQLGGAPYYSEAERSRHRPADRSASGLRGRRAGTGTDRDRPDGHRRAERDADGPSETTTGPTETATEPTEHGADDRDTDYDNTMRGSTTMKKRLLLVLVGLIALAALAAAPPASAQDNSAVAVNTKDGTNLFKFAFDIRRVMGDVVENQNAAVAYANCEDCQTVAVAIQIVLVFSDPSVVTPENYGDCDQRGVRHVRDRRRAPTSSS